MEKDDVNKPLRNFFSSKMNSDDDMGHKNIFFSEDIILGAGKTPTHQWAFETSGFLWTCLRL